MQFYFWIAATFVISMIGEYYCKLASVSTATDRLLYTAIPMLCWGFTGWMWVRMYELKTMAEVVALYSPAILVASAAIGVFIFHEPFTWRLGVSYILVAIIIWLIG